MNVSFSSGRKGFPSYRHADVCLPTLLLHPKSGKMDVNIRYLSSPRVSQYFSCVEYLVCTMCWTVLLSTEACCWVHVSTARWIGLLGAVKGVPSTVGNRDQSSWHLAFHSNNWHKGFLKSLSPYILGWGSFHWGGGVFLLWELWSWK